MAIKVNGTTVIDDSRNISNVGEVVASQFFGDGSNLTGVGGSTDFGAVGTYALVGDTDGTPKTVGQTIAGSSLDRSYSVYNFQYAAISTLSGTWRAMGYEGSGFNGTLFVRIA